MFDSFIHRLQQSGNPSSGMVQNFYGGGPGGYGGYGYTPFGTGGYSPSNPYAHINPYAYRGLDPKENPGDKLFADLIRAQTQDYLTRFAPIENMLANEITATGTKALEGDLQRTRDAVAQSGLNVQGSMNRDAARYGVDAQNLDQNTMTSTLVGGLNATRMRDADRRLALLGGMGAITARAQTVGQP
jgi:hypothetical protein